MGKNGAAKNGEDFLLGAKAADLWLRMADLCANKKVIPTRYRYTTGTSLMQSAETICGAIEEANLINLEGEERNRRFALQRQALRECRKLERRIYRMMESQQYPGMNAQKGGTLAKAVMTVRYMCTSWHTKDQERAAKQKRDTRRV